jgi:hypothetical protein
MPRKEILPLFFSPNEIRFLVNPAFVLRTIDVCRDDLRSTGEASREAASIMEAIARLALLDTLDSNHLIRLTSFPRVCRHE